jgi:two-component system, LytTR family, response regulator
MSMTAILIDDELNNLANLSLLLAQYCPEVEILGTAMDAAEGKELIAGRRPNLVFLDIQMPGTTGLDMLQQLPSHDFEIIFVTAYDNYGIQAVKFAAVDYLLKPISGQELQEAVRKATLRHGEKQKNGQIDNLLQLLQRHQFKDEHRIALSTLKETRFLFTRQIIRCESNNNYCNFYLDNGDKLLVSSPIFEYESLLQDYGFIRCHQSHLINKRHVKSWIRDDGSFLLMEGGDSIPVSRSKKDAVLKALGF